MEIYSLSAAVNNSSSRALLLALAWLITKYDVLGNIVRLKLLNSSLGREFSKVDTDNVRHLFLYKTYHYSGLSIKQVMIHLFLLQNENIDDAKLVTIENQINNLLHKTNKLSSNLKAISELYMEKVKLMTRVHAASITTSGLPHLTVCEMSLIKKISTNRSKSEVELEKLREMEETASLLDTHIKWVKKSHVFHTWMVCTLITKIKSFIPLFTLFKLIFSEYSFR